MQRIPRRGADSTFRSTNAQGKPQPYFIMKNNEISSIIARQVTGNGDAWAKQMKKGEVKRLAKYQPTTMRGEVDALNLLIANDGVEGVVGVGYVAPHGQPDVEPVTAERAGQEEEDEEDPPADDEQDAQAEEEIEEAEEEEENEDAHAFCTAENDLAREGDLELCPDD